MPTVSSSVSHLIYDTTPIFTPDSADSIQHTIYDTEVTESKEPTQTFVQRCIYRSGLDNVSRPEIEGDVKVTHPRDLESSVYARPERGAKTRKMLVLREHLSEKSVWFSNLWILFGIIFSCCFMWLAWHTRPWNDVTSEIMRELQFLVAPSIMCMYLTLPVFILIVR